MKVIEKQSNSRMCVVCGLDNPYGVHAPFYVLEDHSVVTLFQFREEHQSYPGRVHGGMITAMLDELGCRAYWAYDPKSLMVTTSLETRYRKPVPYGVPLKATGMLLSSSSRFIKARAQIAGMDGTVLAEAEMKYIKLPNEKITEADYHEEMCYTVPDSISEI